MIEIEELKDNEWYWISFNKDGSAYFPALWSTTIKNWTNGDTWEDFNHQVKWWKKIELPKL